MADGVVGDTLDVAQTHREQRLGPTESLDLRFLVNSKHDCLIRRVEVEPDDVSYLLDKKDCWGACSRQASAQRWDFWR